MRSAINLPLHYGKAPRWLFNKMVRLSRSIFETILLDHPPIYILKKLSDPMWFQSFGCILGFDWHSSGLTTTVLGAMKMALKNTDIPIFVCGGKGKTARKTPDELKIIGDKVGVNVYNLIKISKLTAKVDNSLIQDGYNIYHHNIIFDGEGNWIVVQQGMNTSNGLARRYHWFGPSVNDLFEEPHAGIITNEFLKPLNLVHSKSRGNRNLILELSRRRPEKNIRELDLIIKKMPERHSIIPQKDINPERLYKIFLKTYENYSDNFENLLLIKGLGPKSIRALSLIAELIYGEKPSYQDPARFSFAHGGKDGVPYPVDGNLYEKTINFFEDTIRKARLGETEKLKLLKKVKEL